MTAPRIVPVDFSDPAQMVERAPRIWGWRFPHDKESEQEYRAAFAAYVAKSSKDEAKAIKAKAMYAMA
jgi:hypothetical protein